MWFKTLTTSRARNPEGSFFVSPNIPGVNIYIEEYSKDLLQFSLCSRERLSLLLGWYRSAHMDLVIWYIRDCWDQYINRMAFYCIKKSNNSNVWKTGRSCSEFACECQTCSCLLIKFVLLFKDKVILFFKRVGSISKSRFTGNESQY